MKKYNILMFNPSIANELGVNEAIILQQLNYWHSKYNFQKWIYNSYEKWQEQFHFWSVRTIRRIFQNLEKRGLILSKRSKDHKLYKLSENAIKKFYSNQDRPACPSRVVNLATSYNKETKNTQRISSYKKDTKKKEEFVILEKNKGRSGKHIVGNEVIDISDSKEIQANVKAMIVIWNDVFGFSLKPIQAFSNKKTIQQLANILESKFNNDLSEWKLYAKKINSSKFLMGEKETKNNFKAEFSWLIKEDVIDSIQSGAYGVGDRTLDSERLEENLKVCEKDVQQKLKDKVSKYLEKKVSLEKEEQEFKKYLVTRKFKKDGDKYQVQKHMESVGKEYMYGEYITASHVFYPGNENYKKRIFNSYLMKKYCGIDETILDSEINSSFKREPNKIALFQTMKNIKNKISNFDVLLDGAKNFQQIVDFRTEARGFCL